MSVRIVTASERGRANRRNGADAERDVARYLRTVGFPHAERAEKNGWRSRNHVSVDPGDTLGIPGTVWSIKRDASNRIAAWLSEVEALRAAHGAELGILVVRRAGKASPGRWWAWVSLPALGAAVTGTSHLSGVACMELGDLVPNLHNAGYGDRRLIP